MSPPEEKPIRQAGVIPYRIGRRGPEFCLITSIPQRHLGNYCYEKWNTSLIVTVYLMEVTAVDDHWEEVSLRDRRWCLPEEARSAIRGLPLETLLDAALQRIEAAGG